MRAEIRNNRIPSLRRNLRTELLRVVDDVADGLRDRAKANAPVQTGALQTSIYVALPGHSDYAAAVAGVKAANPKAQVLEEVPEPPEGQAFVGVAAGHGVPVELGAANRAPKPFLLPAAVAAGPELTAAVTRTVRNTARG